uniref:Mitotic spindle organizing protein 1 n=1 Tax=Buteo japonicus TaxID=224669 RepID=A0A8C0HKF7_9AVES
MNAVVEVQTISRILNTGLDMETLSICVRLCEQGINPEALSSVIKELQNLTYRFFSRWMLLGAIFHQFSKFLLHF